MINNLNSILELLTFDSEDDVYHLQLIKRKKEHPELGSNSQIIKTYYITSKQHLQDKFPEIVLLCDFHNARGSINLNRRSFEKLSFHLLRKVADQIMNRDFRSSKQAYDSVAGAYANEPNKKWIIDIDVKDDKLKTMIANTIKNCEPNPRQDKVYAELETKNGIHLITSPFNVEQFKKFYPSIDIHKDNPTILYVP